MPYRTYVQEPAVTIPAGYEVTDEPGCLTIAWRATGQPLPWAANAFVGMCGILLAHLVLDHRWLLFYLPLTVILGLVALGQLGDRVHVEVRGFALRVAKSPLSTQTRCLAAGEIDQLYCVMHHGEKKHTYELWCQLRGGGRLRLLRRLDTAGAALYLERVLERRLGIADRPVEGELARR